MKRSTPTDIKRRPWLTVRELTALAVFAAAMIALQVTMAPLPNIEPVTLLIILATVFLGPKALMSVAVFVVAEGLIYGVHLWWFSYLYVWPALVLIVLALRRHSHPAVWVLVAGFYGLLFGTLCSLPTFLTGGVGAGIGWIISGIPYDLLHCAGNLVLTAVLYYPLSKVLEKVLKV